MQTLLLSVGVYLDDFVTNESRIAAHGPIFNRWLPNGEADALVTCPNDHTEIKLWFLRRGYTGENGFIRYDHQRQEVDVSIMERQAILKAGPLGGMVTLKKMKKPDLKPIIEDIKGHPKYMTLGKKVVMLVYTQINRLISILRNCYGQYWITPLEQWDCRDETLFPVLPTGNSLAPPKNESTPNG